MESELIKKLKINPELLSEILSVLIKEGFIKQEDNQYSIA